MFRHLRFAILALTAMPVSYSLADGLPLQSRGSSIPSFIRVQMFDPQRCKSLCDTKHKWCLQAARENYAAGMWTDDLYRFVLDECEEAYAKCYGKCN
jgi:hypothetical protein